MVMVRAIVRPERAEEVMAALMADGFPAVTRMNVSGRGKQRGIKIGEVTYDEIPKELLLMVIKNADKEFVVKKIMEVARTGKWMLASSIRPAPGTAFLEQCSPPGRGALNCSRRQKRPELPAQLPPEEKI